ncbi:MAG TPA: asparagine synthase C-terminal domain-containing protein [Nitrososphaera sp.]
MLLDSLRDALYEAVSETASETRVAVAFSGGVDSSLLARICQDLGKEIILVTVGFPGSHDIQFSSTIAAKMAMKQRVFEITIDDFQRKLETVQELTGCANTSHLENCVAYLYISKAAREDGMDVVLSGNGCDELFCGYNGYRVAYNNGENALMKMMGEKITNELELVAEISNISRQFGVEVRQPFLSEKFVRFAKSIPIGRKIKGPDDTIRKHVLREAAMEIGVPRESAMKPKKALQYGSLIHKHFKRIRAQRI